MDWAKTATNKFWHWAKNGLSQNGTEAIVQLKINDHQWKSLNLYLLYSFRFRKNLPEKNYIGSKVFISKCSCVIQSTKKHIPGHDIYKIFFKYMALFSRKSASFLILSTNFTYPIFSWSNPATPENDQNMSQKGTPKHPKIWQNSCSKKHWFLASILIRFWLQKWSQNDPKIDQNGTLGLPRGSLGPLGGARGPTRCLKTDFWLQFGTPNDAKIAPT